jgi:predicted ribosomally synthesized peptide with nif11-like leader
MTTESVERFYQLLSEDEKLEEAYWSALEQATHQTIVKLASEHGIAFTPEDLKLAWEAGEAELGDDELDEVAGGTRLYAKPPTRTGDTSRSHRLPGVVRQLYFENSSS